MPTEFTLGILAMGVLLVGSAFFSGSEAALFSVKQKERRKMAAGSRAGRIVDRLLEDPDRLLTAVLFWNLLINLTYFTITSIIGLKLQSEPEYGAPEAAVFTGGSLLTIIFFSEMLPKSLAVLSPSRSAALVAVPMAAMVRLVDPIIPALRTANLLSRRVLWPRFRSESHLRVSDLERAVELSTSDAALVEQEQRVLQSIVSLSEIRADELMRPRRQFLTFHPPVCLEDLQGRLPPSGYLLVTEAGSDEVAAAIALRHLSNIPDGRLDHFAEPVVYVPWCTTVAQVLEELQRSERQVAAVVNEFGETIGILTFDDLLDTIFVREPSRTQRLLQRHSIRRVSPGVWHVTGMTTLRRLVRHFDVETPPRKSVTVAGILQETLHRFPEPGDRCRWGPFLFEVIERPQRGQLLIQLTLPSGDTPEGSP